MKRTDIIPTAIPPYGAAKVLTMSRMGEKFSIKPLTTTADS